MPGADRRARPRERRLPHPRQTGTGFAAVAVQRLRSLVFLPRAFSVDLVEPAFRQRLVALAEQAVDPRLRPEPIGQRLARHDQQCHQ
ncbi:MAG: hypothetical protein J7507_10280 [Pseudoxanthomonas sp.]|nr:hypothetical protein [Pseudoxanthomonas sp.]